MILGTFYFKVFHITFYGLHCVCKIEKVWHLFSATKDISENYNPGHNILRHFDVWQNFGVTTSETNRDY